MSREEKYRQEQVRRLHRLLDKHVEAGDVELTDEEFIITVPFRWRRSKGKK